MIRPATIRDIPEMVSICDHLLNEGDLAYMGVHNTRGALAQYVASFIGPDNACALVYEQGGAVAGFIFAHAVPSQFGGELVARKASWVMKHKGHGAALLRAAEAWAASKGAKKWFVSLPDPMPRPIMAKLGFRAMETLYEKEIT